MRSPLGKECRKLFRKMMSVEFPDYKEDKTQVMRQGMCAWRCDHPSGLFFWIFLVLHSKNDQFTTEVGWSFDTKLPPSEVIGRKEINTVLEKPIAFRNCCLWYESNWGFWWKLVLRPEEHEHAILYRDDPIEECLPLVAPAVWDAGEKIKEHVVPLFDRIIQKHGSTQVRRGS